ncbi:SGNH/GDSL hydrolase family protein [Alicyclobacillus kakegawensis]|uniref:SGNH/GDSL hydrolase family protein n=1 Tax=Alicyclobacillus kakegawensis TaxID=392012 RepID=UPI0008314923|nr:SGNH/GDSL hydrolase family protein [Alicyclobacillus kakegawensis]
MLYAALGDSITYGYCASSEKARYVNRIQAALSKQERVNMFVRAKPGWTSRQLLKSLKDVPECIWGEARLVTILIGGNDFLKAMPWLLDGNHGRLLRVAGQVQDNLTEIVQTVRSPDSTILIGTMYNPFPNSLVAKECIDTLNQVIGHVATRERLILADVRGRYYGNEHEFVDCYRRGQLRDFRIRNNPIHPNDKGHAAISSVFLAAYRRSLAQTRRTTRRSKTR